MVRSLFGTAKYLPAKEEEKLYFMLRFKDIFRYIFFKKSLIGRGVVMSAEDIDDQATHTVKNVHCFSREKTIERR